MGTTWRGHPLWGLVRLWLVSLLGAWCFESELSGQESSSTPFQVLTNARSVLSLEPKTAERQIQVKISGQVVYADPELGIWFLRDSSAGIFLSRPSPVTRLELGDEVEVEGVSSFNGQDVVLQERKSQVLRKLPLPPASLITLDQMVDVFTDFQWVEIEAPVESARRIGTHLHVVVSSVRDIRVLIPGFPTQQAIPENWVDARMRFRGVWTTRFNSRGLHQANFLYVPSLDLAQMIKPRMLEVEQIPLQPLTKALRFNAHAGESRRIKVSGVVTAFASPTVFYLQDDQTGLRIHTRQTNVVNVGDQAEVVGFPAIDQTLVPQLEESIVRKVSRGKLPEPLIIDLSRQNVDDRQFEARLVQIEGESVGAVPRGSSAELVVRAGARYLSARLPGTNAAGELARFKQFSKVQIRGVCVAFSQETPASNQAYLLLRTPQDVLLLRPEPWWTLPKAVAVSCFLCMLLLAWRLIGWRREMRMERRYRTIFENALDLISMHAADGTFLDANPAWKNFMGEEAEPTERTRLHQLVALPDQPGFEEWWKQLLTGEQVSSHELRLSSGPNKRAIIEMRGSLAKHAGPEIRVEIFARDVSEKKLAEEQGAAYLRGLESSEERFRLVVEAAPNAMIVTDRRGVVTLVNTQTEELFGYHRNELLGQPIDHLIPERLREKHRQAYSKFNLQAGSRLLGAGEELFARRKDGTELQVEIRLSTIRSEQGQFLLASIVDITPRKRAEEDRKALESQLRQAQKMESIGTLAGGIAHDFNNILGVIIGNAELAALDVQPGDELRPPIDEILKASRRAKDLVAQILSFSRQQVPKKQVLDLQSTITEIVPLLRATIPAGVDIIQCYEPDVPAVIADPTGIYQILLNVCTNAWHALEGGPGRIYIRLDTLVADEKVLKKSPKLKPGVYARLVIEDNGAGMDQETRERIFDPFFTTKQVGKGTGLGLSVVHGIMENHEGAILVQSEKGRGSCFEFCFPVADGARHAEPVLDGNRHISKGDGLHILYVDDEPSLVTLAKRSLTRKGFQITACMNMEGALTEFRPDPSRFDLLITDYNMPGGTGLELIRSIRKIRPELPIILVSGYLTEEIRKEAALAGVDHLLLKPVEQEELNRILNQLLGGPAARIQV